MIKVSRQECKRERRNKDCGRSVIHKGKDEQSGCFRKLCFQALAKQLNLYKKLNDRYEKDSIIVSVRSLMAGTLNDEGEPARM